MDLSGAIEATLAGWPSMSIVTAAFARIVLAFYRSALVAICVIPAGCTGKSSDGTFVVSDSAGIAIVDNREIGELQDLPSLLDMGGAQAFPELELVGARWMRFLSDGRVAITDGGSASIVLLDPRSRTSTAIGRRGEGPGEFTYFRELARCRGDSLAVLSHPMKLSVLDGEGGLGRSGTALHSQPYSIAGVAADCTTMAFVRQERLPDQGELRPNALVVYWTRESPDSSIEVAHLPGPEGVMVEGTSTSVRRPYGHAASWTVIGDHLVLGSGAEAEVRWYDRRGVLERIVRWPATPAPITDSDRARFEEMRRSLEALPSGEGYALFRLDRITLPKVKPVYSRFFGDAAGNLWIQKYPDLPMNFEGQGYPMFGPQGRVWWIFSPAGRLLATGSTPADFWIRDVQEGMVVGVIPDANGFEVVNIVPLSAGVRQALGSSSTPPA